MSTIFQIKVRNKSSLFSIDLNVKTLYFLTSSRVGLRQLKMQERAMNCS